MIRHCNTDIVCGSLCIRKRFALTRMQGLFKRPTLYREFLFCPGFPCPASIIHNVRTKAIKTYIQIGLVSTRQHAPSLLYSHADILGINIFCFGCLVTRVLLKKKKKRHPNSPRPPLCSTPSSSKVLPMHLLVFQNRLRKNQYLRPNSIFARKKHRFEI